MSEFCVIVDVSSSISFCSTNEPFYLCCLVLMCFDVFRDLVHRTAHQPGRCNWGDSHGSAFWIWRCQLPIHIYVLLPQVMCILSLSFFFLIIWIYVILCYHLSYLHFKYIRSVILPFYSLPLFLWVVT